MVAEISSVDGETVARTGITSGSDKKRRVVKRRTRH